MKTILFVWELGSAYGHAAPLTAIAKAIAAASKDQGTEINLVFALRDPILGRRIVGPGHIVLPVPHLQHLTPIAEHSGSYTDLLIVHGFGKRDELTLALAAWDDLFSLVKPDLIVADHSPTAILAAKGSIPTIVTGNGFTVPPADLKQFPALRRNLPPPASQAVILDVINKVQADRGRLQLAQLPQLLQGEGRIIFTLPHLDPYEGIRSEPLLGPYQTGLEPAPLPENPAMFYYGQSGHKDVDDITWALIETAYPKICVFSGPVSVSGKVLQDSGAEVHFTPPLLADVLNRSSLVISHGGSGVAQAALKIGRPQVVLPIHFESMVTAAQLEATGTAVVLEEPDASIKRITVKDQLKQAIDKAIHATDLADNAIAVSQQIKRLKLPESPTEVAASMCMQLLDT